MIVRNPETGKLLKNPELFIRRLQHRIAELQHYVRIADNRAYVNRGETILLWDSQALEVKAKGTAGLIKFDVGDIVAHIGTVISAHASKYANGNKESTVHIKLLQTRKMPKDFC